MEGREMETQRRKCGAAGTERNKGMGNEKRRNICGESWVQYEDEYGKRKRRMRNIRRQIEMEKTESEP